MQDEGAESDATSLIVFDLNSVLNTNTHCLSSVRMTFFDRFS